MESILAYGDSNTWGFIPGSKNYIRYPYEKRWTGILQNKLPDAQICEEGLCGRTTIFEDEIRQGRRGLSTLPIILETHNPLKAVFLMLGTNDCKSIYGASSYMIGKGIELCLDEIEKFVSPDRILLISPIHLGQDVWRPDKDPEFNKHSVEISYELKDVYKEIAQRRGTQFLAASDQAKPDDADNEHLNEKGHQILAEAIYEKYSKNFM